MPADRTFATGENSGGNCSGNVFWAADFREETKTTTQGGGEGSGGGKFRGTVVNCIGIGFQRGTRTRWQLVANDGTGALTLTDMGASFAIATGGLLTLFITAPPNGSSVR